jgi:hypothetical protein
MSEDKQADGSKQAVFRVYSEQWEAWRRYHIATGDRQLASLMTHQAERGRWGEWAEATEWPPSSEERKKESGGR